jgi:hypothetical protein
VTVPVLSSTITFALRAVSRASPPLISIPCCAPLPVPTITATGVASPSAHGQAIISTEISTVNASLKSPVPMSHAVPASMARAMTTGTNMPEILSASLAMGAFDPCASSMSFTIRARVVALPTRVARQTTEPLRLMLPPVTSAPSSFSTGVLSPVSIDSSAEVMPSVTIPSTGNLSPGLTITSSSTLTLDAGTVFSLPSRRTVARGGARLRRVRMAFPAFDFDLASRYRPVVIRVMIVAADS